MPGANDQLANTPPGVDQASPRGPDPVSPRELDPVIAELRGRMERLPPGHPSSPYNDDGSRKPPPPDLSAYELPIQGDPDYQPEPSIASETDRLTDEAPEAVGHRQHVDDKGAADDAPTPDSETARPSDSEDKPRSRPDGSWEWKGRALTPEESHSSDQALGRWTSAEGRDADGNYGGHGLTPAMRRIEAQLDSAHLADGTEDYALKTPDRFKEKVAREKERNPDKPTEEVIAEIHDAVRYTYILDIDEYHKTYWEAEGKLESQGYELEVRRNMWASLEYKGINSRWRDLGSSLPFEIQFHTEDSWEAKQRTHASYEKIEDVRTLAAEREQLREHQKEISAKIQEPPRVMEIPDYRKKAE
jgi:hypothetical protein